jgi:hypothetical protein
VVSLVSRQERRPNEDMTRVEVGLPGFSLGMASRRGCDKSKSWTPRFLVRKLVRAGHMTRTKLKPLFCRQEPCQDGTCNETTPWFPVS